MAFLRREFYLQVKGPEITYTRIVVPLSSTLTPNAWMSSEAHLETCIGGTRQWILRTIQRKAVKPLVTANYGVC
jgi:hypothetical protein